MCSRCKVIKLETEFYFSKRDGYCSPCKECARAYQTKIRPSRKEYMDEYQEKNKEKLQKYRHERYIAKKEAGEFETEEFKAKEVVYRKRTYEKNKHKYRKRSSAYHKKRRQTDPMFRLAMNLRKRTNVAIRKKYWNKLNSAHKFLGCSLEELRFHIESQFREGMSWENYGKWHLDHIIPLVSAKTVDEIYELCHYTNLQPLWAEENARKNAKIIKKEET